MNYKIEELLPIVAELTERYTSKESTSISYEKARQLMEAVLYCMNHCGGDNQLVSREGTTAKEAYQLGYENLIQKVKKVRTLYNEMIMDFNSYGNENYDDTVTKAIPGFFRYYDVRFAPQDTIITMDYPTLCPIAECSGIDAVEKYVKYISYEQKFMKVLPEEFVYEVLYRFQTGYRKQFYNISRIILRHILSHMLIGKNLGKISDEADYKLMYEIVQAHTVEWLNKTFPELLEKLIQEKYHSDKEMETYLQGDINDFVTELFVAAQNGSIKKVVVI